MKYKYFRNLSQNAQTLIFQHSPEGTARRGDDFVCYKCAKQSERNTHKTEFHKTGKEKTEDTNIKAMLDGILQHGMFHECDENQGLWNIFTDYKATAEQSHDMLNYREIGQVGFETYVSGKILKQVSTKAPLRKKKLCTFTVSKKEKQRVK